MHLNGLDLWLWLVTLLEHIVLLAGLISRRHATRFPVFTACMTLNVIKTVTLFFVLHYGSAYAYYYTYLCLDAFDCLLQIVLAYEIALHVFRPLGHWAPAVRSSFFWTAGIALVISFSLAWIALPATVYLSDTLLIRGNLLSAALMSELLVGMLFLSGKFGLPWRTHAARIAQGLGVYSFVCIVFEALHTYFGVRSGTDAFRVISRLRITAYVLVVLFWISTLMRDAPEEREIPDNLQRRLVALHRRASMLASLLHSWRRA